MSLSVENREIVIVPEDNNLSSLIFSCGVVDSFSLGLGMEFDLGESLSPEGVQVKSANVSDESLFLSGILPNPPDVIGDGGFPSFIHLTMIEDFKNHVVKKGMPCKIVFGNQVFSSYYIHSLSISFSPLHKGLSYNLSASKAMKPKKVEESTPLSPTTP